LTVKIAAEGTSIIPALTVEDILNTTEGKRNTLKEVGCFVVRNVVSRSDVATWFHTLKNYVAHNKGAITGAYISAEPLSVLNR
jgi:hypothetical protein